MTSMQAPVYDVVVVGAGLAGNTAALSAAESSASVLLLEKGEQYGGSSVKAGGGMLFAGTDIQMAAGVDDDNEKLSASILSAGHGKNHPAPVQAYLDHQLDTYEFMQRHGIEFTLATTGTDAISRMHAAPQGYATKVMHEKFVALNNADYWPSSTARRLVQDADGRICGIVLERDGRELVVNARRAVILTSGGFVRSRELLETFAPQWADATKMGGVHNTGDGMRMAWAVGADLADMSYIEASFGASIKNYPDLSEDPEDEPRLLYPNTQGAIIVNLDGKRFVDENLNYKIISTVCVKQPEGVGFQIFDDSMMNRSQAAPTPADFKTALADGYVIAASTVEDLADKLRIDSANLRATVDAYNGYADAGTDPDFGRSMSDYGAERGGHLDTAPYYAFPCRSGLTTTYCGVRVDERLRVVDVFGEPILGLFAAGEVVGGFHGATYLSGTGLGKAGVFGRAAGLSSVANFDQQNIVLTSKETPMPELVPDFHEVLTKTAGPAATLDVFRRWHEAVDAKDLEGVRACMSENILIEIPFSESGQVEEGKFRTYSGIEKAVEFWAVAFKAEGDSAGACNCEITVSADGTTVFLETYGKLTMATGRDYRNRYIMKMVIDNGLVTHVREYYNPIQSAYAFGRPIAGHIPVDSLSA